MEKKHTLWDVLCRIVQSVFLAAEITVLADLLFAAGENPLPRAAFWGLVSCRGGGVLALAGVHAKGAAHRIPFHSGRGRPLGARALRRVECRGAENGVRSAGDGAESDLFRKARARRRAARGRRSQSRASDGQFTDARKRGVRCVRLDRRRRPGWGRSAYTRRSTRSRSTAYRRRISSSSATATASGRRIHIYNAAPNAVTPSLSGGRRRTPRRTMKRTARGRRIRAKTCSAICAA